MVKAKLEKKIKQDPVSAIIVILVFVALMLGVLVYMHHSQNDELRQLRSDVDQLVESRNVR